MRYRQNTKDDILYGSPVMSMNQKKVRDRCWNLYLSRCQKNWELQSARNIA